MSDENLPSFLPNVSLKFEISLLISYLNLQELGETSTNILEELDGFENWEEYLTASTKSTD